MTLKSGTDIRGVCAGEGITLSPEIAKKCAYAYVELLSRLCDKAKDTLCLAVGRDCRVSSPALSAAVIEGFSAAGAKVLDCGGATTPSMFFATQYADCDGAVEITASHLPWNRNGLKFFTKEGGLEGSQIAEILTAASEVSVGEAKGEIVSFDIMTPYKESLVKLVRERTGKEKPLCGKKVVVNAGNGMGGFFTAVLEALGADTVGSVNLTPDGMFPVHVPNPENAPAMEATAAAVKASGADLGICFDTDCDRAAIVDGDGAVINSSRLIGLISTVLLQEYPGCTIVTDSVTSAALTSFIEKRGGKHHRFRRGYKNVINEAKRLEAEGVSAPLAIETSGHAALKENFYQDDGAYLVVKLLILLSSLKEGETPGHLISDLPAPFDAREIRMKIQKEDFSAYGKEVLDGVGDFFTARGLELVTPNFEGVRAATKNGDGWILIRMSLHDPVIPINMEGDSTAVCDEMQNILFDYLAKFDALEKM